MRALTDVLVALPVADLRGGGTSDARSRGSKFFQFHADFGKIYQNHMLVLPEELAPLPRGNPGSATDYNGSVPISARYQTAKIQ